MPVDDKSCVTKCFLNYCIIIRRNMSDNNNSTFSGVCDLTT